jgi:hypothetical protein
MTVIRSRTVRVAATAVLGLTATAALSGCGGPMQAGTAVIVNGHRTSDGQVQSQVAELVVLAQRNGVPDAVPNAGIAQAQVNVILQGAIWQQLVNDLGLTVTPQALAKVRVGMIQSARQSLTGFSGTDDQAIALGDAESQNPNDVAPTQVSVFVQTQADINAVVAAESPKLKITDLTDPASQQKLQAAVLPLLDIAAGELKITVSPRYGTYDARQRGVVTALPAWIRQSAASQPATQPQAPAQ